MINKKLIRNSVQSQTLLTTEENNKTQMVYEEILHLGWLNSNSNEELWIHKGQFYWLPKLPDLFI